jgi:hypothetical protein
MARLLRLLAVALLATGCGSDDAADPALLIESRDEPAGARCSHGGTAVHSGRDRDGDGHLGAGEVEQVAYVCAGAPVPAQLVRTRRVPTGEECPGGGTAVELGADRDGDGILDDHEVTSTSYACEVDEVWEGDVGVWVWGDPTALARLREATVITGNLRVATTGPMSLPRLRTVAGDIWIWSSNGVLELPALTTVGGELDLEDADLVGEVVLPALTTVGEDARLGSGAGIDRLSLPSLAYIGGSLILGAWPLASALDLPALHGIGGSLHAPEAPAAARLPALYSVVGDVTLDLRAATAVALPALTAVGGALVLDGPALTSIALPRLARAGSLHVAAPLLTELRLRSLATVRGALEVHAAALTTLELPTLASVGEPTAGDGRGLVVTAGALRELQLAALVQAPDGIAIASPVLTRIEAPQVTAVRALAIDGPVTTLAVDALTAIDRLELRGTALVDLAALAGLERANDVALVGNPRLTSLASLGALGALDALTVADNPALTTLEGLHRVATAGDVAIEHNGIVSVEGLRSLHDVAGDLSISGNGALTSIAGLARLSRVGAALGIAENPLVPADEIAALRARLAP